MPSSRQWRTAKYTKARRPSPYSGTSVRKAALVSPFPMASHFRPRVYCSLESWNWKLGGPWEGTIQTCFSAPYLFQILPRSFGRFLPTAILPFVLFVFFFTPSAGSHVGTFAACFFLHLAEGYECGLASVDGAPGSWFCFGTITV